MKEIVASRRAGSHCCSARSAGREWGGLECAPQLWGPRASVVVAVVIPLSTILRYSNKYRPHFRISWNLDHKSENRGPFIPNTHPRTRPHVHTYSHPIPIPMPMLWLSLRSSTTMIARAAEPGDGASSTIEKPDSHRPSDTLQNQVPPEQDFMFGTKPTKVAG